MRKLMCCFACAVLVVVLIGYSTSVVQGKCIEAQAVNPADFNSPVDNTYWPMAVGLTYRYEAETEDGLARNEITATSETKVILGVTCIVVHDEEWEYIEDEAAWFLMEDTNDWHGWDNYGNVWYFGEETVEYLYDDDWNPIGSSTEGSWEAGVDGALPGIVMLSDPEPGVCYEQEYYEGEAEDMGKVKRLGASVSVEYGDFDDCLKTKEWTPLEPGEIEHKYYAPGVGLVFIEELKEKTVKVELVDVY
ncbi:MAG: hypothetical protein ACYTBJ_18240 [Planctomycetota bacterium]